MSSARRAHQRPPSWWTVGAALALSLVVVAATTGFLLRPAQTAQEFAVARVAPEVHSTRTVTADSASGLHLYLIPHADDELSAWTSLADGSGLYPVLVLLTQGEQTARCTPEKFRHHAQINLGEWLPTPVPTAGRGTRACREARWAGFQMSLREAAEHTPAVHLADTQESTLTLDGGPAAVLKGRHSTVVALDLGDGQLTAESVLKAVDDVLDLSGDQLPDLPLTRVTSSAYVGSGSVDESSCDQPAVCPADDRPYDYVHPDHVATAAAARSLAPRTTQGSYVVTHSYDPAATEHRAMPQEVYDAFMALGPGDFGSARRVGGHQRIYGWLAFPDVWRPGDLPLQSTRVAFSRVQSYEVLTP